MPSRRSLITTASATAALLAGCTGLAAPTDEQTPTAAGFAARLDGSETTRRLFDGGDVASVGDVSETRTGAYALPVTLADDATTAATETFREAGVDDSPDEFEVVLESNGETAGRFGVSPGLADRVTDGDWDGSLRLVFQERASANDVRRALSDDGTE